MYRVRHLNTSAISHHEKQSWTLIVEQLQLVSEIIIIEDHNKIIRKVNKINQSRKRLTLLIFIQGISIKVK